MKNTGENENHRALQDLYEKLSEAESEYECGAQLKGHGEVMAELRNFIDNSFHIYPDNSRHKNI
jgi:hypothetical protein